MMSPAAFSHLDDLGQVHVCTGLLKCVCVTLSFTSMQEKHNSYQISQNLLPISKTVYHKAHMHRPLPIRWALTLNLQGSYLKLSRVSTAGLFSIFIGAELTDSVSPRHKKQDRGLYCTTHMKGSPASQSHTYTYIQQHTAAGLFKAPCHLRERWGSEWATLLPSHYCKNTHTNTQGEREKHTQICSMLRKSTKAPV